MSTCTRKPRSYWTTCVCDDCSLDRRRTHKLYNGGRPWRIPSDFAWNILAAKIDSGWTALAISSATGLPETLFGEHLNRYRATGARRTLSPATAAAIVAIGRPTKGQVGAEPSRRRLRALGAIGWPLRELANETGIGFSTLGMIRGTNERIGAATANTIADTYQRLHMTPGPNPLVGEQSRQKGWPPPLAWEDIDDQNETPTGWEYEPGTRLEIVADLNAHGYGISEVCRRLKLSRDAIEKWSERNGVRDLYVQMLAREDGMRENRNQQTKEAS